MTSLNPSLRLALLQKAKGKKNILQKGFTLVELMVVIVIVGILSAVALPSFLNQRGKAESTEAIQQIGLMLKEAKIQALEQVAASTIVTNLTSTKPTNTNFAYTITTNNAGDRVCVSAVATGGSLSGLTNKHLGGDIELAEQKPTIKQTLVSADPYTAGCA